MNLSYVKRFLPIADKAFAETYFSGLEKADFPACSVDGFSNLKY